MCILYLRSTCESNRVTLHLSSTRDNRLLTWHPLAGRQRLLFLPELYRQLHHYLAGHHPAVWTSWKMLTYRTELAAAVRRANLSDARRHKTVNNARAQQTTTDGIVAGRWGLTRRRSAVGKWFRRTRRKSAPDMERPISSFPQTRIRRGIPSSCGRTCASRCRLHHVFPPVVDQMSALP